MGQALGGRAEAESYGPLWQDLLLEPLEGRRMRLDIFLLIIVTTL